MDRLLTDDEILARVNNKVDLNSVIFIWLQGIAKAQDTKTAHLVATEMIKELEEPCPHESHYLKLECRFCLAEIKQRWLK